VVEALGFTTGIQLLLETAVLLVVRQGTGGPTAAFRAPWMWAGGLMGLLVVFSIIFAQPRLGAGAALSLAK